MLTGGRWTATIGAVTYLLLGESDVLSEAVGAALRATGRAVCQLRSPLHSAQRFSWRLGEAGVSSELQLPDGTPLTSTEIEGVLIRPSEWLATEGWAGSELAYAQAEAQATMLAWLWSLDCAVVNRYPAQLWYQPQPSLLHWRPALYAAGVPVVEGLISNDVSAARDFGPQGAVYTPLTDTRAYRIGDAAGWAEVARLQQHLPVALSPLHATAHLACVVGDTVIWQQQPAEVAHLEAALRRFASAVGLACLTVAFADSEAGATAIAVTSHAQFDAFGTAAQEQIVEALVKALGA